eukprot:TRINITY_DN6567_c0_g1_i2.p1 TRINITY_DN6567_c0_g1~~TRINITY_DN6567_c0_g1_i2.p1  ORF type:complete len:109 (+),score=10.76 TRINITY_DN6567_c0_g1_i2:111-437(+)
MLRQNPKTTITFIRHAQSLYNLAQMQAKESNAEVRGDYDFKTDTREDLIDCDLTEQGMKEVHVHMMLTNLILQTKVRGHENEVGEHLVFNSHRLSFEAKPTQRGFDAS